MTTLPALQPTADGDIVFPTVWIDGPEAIVQKAIVRLRTFLGEWVLDRSKGIDWIGFHGKITTQRLEVIRGAIVAEMADLEGVRVDTSTASFADRVVSVTFTATIGNEDNAEDVFTADFGVGRIDGRPMHGVADLLTLQRLIRGGARAAR